MDTLPSAASFLSEIRSESLQHLLTATRKSGQEWHASLASLDTDFFPQPAQGQACFEGRGDVIEIQGPATSGKSHLVYHMLATCITPSHHQSVNLGGWNKVAILIDADGTFRIERFQQLLLARLVRLLSYGGLATNSGLSTRSVLHTAEDLASRCLHNLHVFRPTSSHQLAATLLHLPQYHASHPGLQCHDIGLLAIDSMSAWYWNDRFTVEQLRHDVTSRGQSVGGPFPGASNPLRAVVAALQSFRETYGCPIALTNWGLNLLKKSNYAGDTASPFYKQHLHPFPSPFEKPSAISGNASILYGSNVTRFPPADGAATTSVEQEATNVAGSDTESVERSFSVTHHITLQSVMLNPLPSNGAPADLEREDRAMSAVARGNQVQCLVRALSTARVGKFSLYITDHDVLSELEFARGSSQSPR